MGWSKDVALLVPGAEVRTVPPFSLSGDEGGWDVGGSSRVGELDAEAWSVGEGVAAVIEANVLDELVQADMVGRADAAHTTAVYESPALVIPAVDVGLMGSLLRGLFPLGLLRSVCMGTTSE